MALKTVADVDLLVQTLASKGATDIQVVDVGVAPESYKTWRARRPERIPQGLSIAALLNDMRA